MLKLLCLAAILAVVQSASTRQFQPNRYYAYRRPNFRDGVQVLPTAQSIEASGLEPTKLTVILVHGHGGSAFTSLNPLLREELLYHHDVNVIVVDWSLMASFGYNMAVNAVPNVGVNLGLFIEALVAAEFPLSNIHLIGFDLGAHVCAFAGRQLNREIAKITALNPSGQQWGPSTARLTRNDARLVEVIHTNSFFGINDAIGDVDFFVNNGVMQPGCSTNECSRIRAYEVMAASVSTTINGNYCATLAEVGSNTCRGRGIPLGGIEVVKRGFGIHRANTGNIFPYA